MKTTLMRVLCCSAMLGFGCATPHRPDSLTLQGTWSGQEVMANKQVSSSLIIKGTDLEFHGEDNADDWLKGTFTLREDKIPKRLDGVVTDSASAQEIGKLVHVIYKFDGATLTMTGYEPGNPAVPKSFGALGARTIVFSKNQ